MGLLSPSPNTEPDAELAVVPQVEETRYITWRGHLYEIVGLDDEGLLHVINCQTMHPLWLDASDVKDAEPLERPVEAA